MTGPEVFGLSTKETHRKSHETLRSSALRSRFTTELRERKGENRDRERERARELSVDRSLRLYSEAATATATVIDHSLLFCLKIKLVAP
ncbi:hypothetical protein Ahy_A03g010956 isoform A [Arachis hypogaea]|uniref:Uncharacterized protein n=1 Tax=Arachis hypogaea TaxID=3818 RepID=A0A445DP32_ARAHY|nr:hypothetical protein Ahy_A03g010956 isoform A [Arachis hypogaea]